MIRDIIMLASICASLALVKVVPSFVAEKVLIYHQESIVIWDFDQSCTVIFRV